MAIITIPSLVLSNELNGQEVDENVEENGSMLQKSASQQYPTFQSSPQQQQQQQSSNFDHHHHQRTEEFGLRKANQFESSQMNDGGDYSTQHSHQYQTSMNIGDQNNNGDGSSIQSPYREYGPSIYNMPSMNNGDMSQSYGQNGDNGNGQDSNQETGSFTPVSLSVDEAFRKYFPDDKDGQNDPFSSQQQQQQSIQGQSMDGYPNQQANSDKEVVSIDSLREIVEKQPLARPDPFDPPSPPLSAFLPPPPDSQLVESSGPQQQQQQSNHQQQQYQPQPMASSTTSSEQISSNNHMMIQSDSGSSSSQSYMNQNPHPQIPIPPINTFKAPEPEIPQSTFLNQPQMISQPPISKFSFPQDSMLSSMNNGNDDNVDSVSGDDNDDEGYAYNTENLDENGKKVLVYQRPVDLAEINTGNKFDMYGQTVHSGQSSNQEINTMYRKPFDNNNDKNNGQTVSTSIMDQGMNIQDSLMNDNYKYQNEITITRDKPSMENDQMYQMNPIEMRPPPSTLFTDFTEYEPSGHLYQNQPQLSHQSDQQQQHQQQQQQQQSWTHQMHNNMPSMEFGGKMTEGPQQIEYGGFVPIKKPHMINSDMNNQQQQQQQSFNGGDYIIQNSQQSKAPYEYNANNNNNNVEYIRQQQQQQQMPQQPQPSMGNMIQISPSSPSQGSMSQQQSYRQNINYESGYHGPGTFNEIPSIFDKSNIQHEYSELSGPSSHQHQQMSQQQNGGGGYQEHEHFHVNKIHDVHVKPLWGKDATKKLRELGINENEFYGTVNKIIQKSRPGDNNNNKPNHFESSRMPLLPSYLPKVNLYRSPPKNRQRHFNKNKNRYFHNNNNQNNMIAEDFEMKFLKDELPPGASYNPRDVGLDESVLAQIHLLDSGIGGYRFPGPMSNSQPSSSSSNYRSLFRKPSMPYKKSNTPSSTISGNGPHAMNSIIMPFIHPSPNGQHHHHHHHNRSPSRNKGFYPVYGYRAAASELKPQFILPKGKHFKFLNQKQPKLSPSSSSNSDSGSINLFLSPSSSSSPVSSITTIDGNQRPLTNIFGIRSIKGIRSLVSYLTGGVSG
uniref:Uncharacterized protein DDB_G0283357-like isoform X1 n=1 Tax=Dermatophagoides pteronyssinus TaxID=6956 RepID=A0A6P6YMD5_DERPT|nr:uncharacterized protein DDB_G0283357-like isoform X1 [Dermatophagoides pteronyssinus]